jgi:hypothetical protein
LTAVTLTIAVIQVGKAGTVHSGISADLDEQDQGTVFTARGAGPTVIIPAKEGRDLVGQVVIVNRGGVGTCQVQSTDGLTNIGSEVEPIHTISVPISTLGPGTPTGFTTGEGIQVIGQIESTACTVTVLTDSNNG